MSSEIHKHIEQSLEKKINLFNAEVINFPFSNSNEDNCIEILNPLDSNKKFLRTNLIDSLKENLIYNEKRQKDSIKLFEISDIYSEIGNIRSEKRLALIVSGRRGLNYEEFSKKLNDKYLEDLFAGIGINIKDKVFIIERKDLDSKSKAKVFGLEKRGEIKPGNFADIIIWDDDPLEPSSMPEYVFINGKSIDLTTRSSRLRDRYTTNPEKPNTYRN